MGIVVVSLWLVGLLTVSAAVPAARVVMLPDQLTLVLDETTYQAMPLPSGDVRRQPDGGYALHMPLPSRNFLPSALTGTNEVAQPPGTRLHRDAGTKAWESPPVPVEFSFHESLSRPGHFGLIFSAYVRSGSDNPVTLSMTWHGEATAVSDQTESVTAVSMAGEWQRLHVPVSLTERRLSGIAQVRIAAKDSLEIAGLQLEPWGDYPVFQRQPTLWMPGGTVRQVRPPTLSATSIRMDWQQGSVSLRAALHAPVESVTGERQILFVGHFWDGPLEIMTDRVRVGVTTLRAPELAGILRDGREHRLLLSWDTDVIQLFVDDLPVAKGAMRPEPVAAAPNARIWIGTHNPRPRNFGGTIRDLRFHNRPLTPETEPPLLSDTNFLVLETPLRYVFRRDESDVTVVLPLAGTIPDGLKVSLHGVPGADAAVVRTDGAAAVHLRLQPWHLDAGAVAAEIHLESPDGSIRRWPWPIHIVPALPRDRYPVGNWGSPGTLADLEWARDVGLTLIDSRNRNAEYLNQVALHGLLASVNYRNIQSKPHPATPEHLERVRFDAERLIADIRPFPWVVSCVLNSEGQGTDAVRESPWAMASLKAVLGLDEPLFPPVSNGLGLASRPKVDLTVFAETGIVPDDTLSLRYVNWLMFDGDGMNRISRMVTEPLAREAPWVEVVMEPATPRPMALRYAEWADVLSNWRYANRPAPMLTVWRQGLAAARAAGKRYYPLTGHQYFSPRIFVTSGEKRVEVPPSGDMAAAFLWTGLALPADQIRCWGWWQRNWAENERLRPGGNARLKEAIAAVSHLGPVVGNVPLRPAKLAVLMPVVNMLGRAHDEWWHAYGGMVYDVVSLFGEQDLPVDFLYEEHILSGSLDTYAYLYIPALRYQRASVHAAVERWREQGGHLILDNQASPAFAADTVVPLIAAERIGLRYAIDAEACMSWIADFRRRVPSFARLESGDAIVITKEQPGTHFVFAINNRWAESRMGEDLLGIEQGGDIIDEVAEFAAADHVQELSAELRDVGVAHTITLSLAAAPEAAIYDLRTGLRLDTLPGTDGRRNVSVLLPPGDAAVLAVYPRPAGRVLVHGPEKGRPGEIVEMGIQLQDEDKQRMSGRQGIRLEVRDAAGRLTDDSAVYRLEDGQTSVPLRLPLTAATGLWQILATHMASSLSVEHRLRVEP